MKQLHVVQSIAKDFGGLGTAALQYAEISAINGAEVELFVLERPKSEMVMECSGSNLRIVTPERAGYIGMLLALKRQIFSNAYDVIHIHGTWTLGLAFASKLAAIRGIKVAVSPHGCLEPWALAHKKWKKRIALFLYQKWVFKSANLIFATAKQELESIRALGVQTDIVVLPIGVDLPTLRPKIFDGFHRFLFLSRIHPKKGLINLIDAWSRVRRQGWKIIIAGPDDMGHQAQVFERIKLLGLEADFEFPGLVLGDKKSRLFESANIFILPTHSENFGIVIAEALSYELPVITTTGAPWRDLLESSCGWWVKPTIDGIAEAMILAMNLSHNDRLRMGQRGRELVAKKYSRDLVGRSSADAYKWMIDPSPNIPAGIDRFKK